MSEEQYWRLSSRLHMHALLKTYAPMHTRAYTQSVFYVTRLYYFVFGSEILGSEKYFMPVASCLVRKLWLFLFGWLLVF